MTASVTTQQFSDTASRELTASAKSVTQLAYEPETQRLRLANYASLRKAIDTARAQFDRQTFVTDDDRKLAKAARATVVKWTAEVRKSVRLEIDRYTASVKDDSSKLADAAQELIDAIDSELKRFDDEFKAKRQQQLEAEFKLWLDSKLAVVTDRHRHEQELYQACFNPRWLNRSMPLAEASAEMAERLHAVAGLLKRSGMRGPIKAAQLLAQCEWSFLDALEALDARQQAAANAHPDTAGGRANKTEPAELSGRLCKVAVTLPSDQLPVLEGLVNAQGWMLER